MLLQISSYLLSTNKVHIQTYKALGNKISIIYKRIVVAFLNIDNHT